MFPYRGFMLDSVRHMQSVEEIKRLIDAIALLKFNKFHWHLTDDQGWRFESEKYPLLNTVSAVRPYSDFGKTLVNEPYGRVYTKDEMRDIVAYCAERGIEVVPEFDMPGHTSALLSAYPHLSCSGEVVNIKTHQGIFKDVLCISKDEALNMVTNIIDELLEVFPGEYIHIGGDETPSAHWRECPHCQALMRDSGVSTYSELQNVFMNKVIDHLESKGRHAIVWNDAASGANLDKRAIVQYWKEKPEPTVRFLNEGGRAILSPFSYYYLDYDYSIAPLNRVYSFGATLPHLTDEGKRNIIGLEAPIWTEYIDNDKRLEEMIFPRLIAVSKASLGEAEKPYKEFLNDVRATKDALPHISFMPESEWTKPRSAFISGWLRFVKDHYTKRYIKEQLFE